MRITTHWVGDNLYNARIQRGQTQQELAADIGTSLRSFTAWERGEATPGGAWARRLNEYFGKPDPDQPEPDGPQHPPIDPRELLASGSRIHIEMHLAESDGGYAIEWTGTITDVGTIPAPYIALTDVTFNLGGNRNRTGDNLIFIGPGVVIRPATPPKGEQP